MVGSVNFGVNIDAAGGDYDAVVAKFDANGTCTFARRAGDGNNEAATSARFDVFGNVIVAGYFNGTINFGNGAALTTAGGADGFVTKLDPTGVMVWQKQYGAAGDQQVECVATDATANIAYGQDGAGFYKIAP
jgi:hypothetical protein